MQRWWARCLVAREQKYHVVAYPKIAGATYWWKAADYNVINAYYYALCISFPSWQAGRTSFTVSFNISYCWQTWFAFLVYLGCDLQTSGFAVGRQLPADTCSPGEVCAEMAGRQTCSPRAGEGRPKSQACVNGATGCVNKPTRLRINVGCSHGIDHSCKSGCGRRGGVAYNLWVVMQCCFGGSPCSSWSPTHWAQRLIISPSKGDVSMDAKALLRSLCYMDLSSLGGFSSLAREMRQSWIPA